MNRKLSLSPAVVLLQVFVKRDGEKMSLVVDGISSQSRRIPAAVATHLSGPLHVGGAPAALLVKHLHIIHTTSATTVQQTTRLQDIKNHFLS